MKDRFENFDKQLNEKQKESDQYRANLKWLTRKHKELENQSERQQKKIQHFEDKYKGVDIAKIREELEGFKTKLYKSQIDERATLAQLYEVRDKMLDIAQKYDKYKQTEIDNFLKKPKTYNGPAQAFTDPELSKTERKITLKARKQQEWKGNEDVELICETFMNFLTTPSALANYGVD